MVKSLSDVLTKLLYTILTSIEFQWIFNFTISELAVNAKPGLGHVDSEELNKFVVIT